MVDMNAETNQGVLANETQGKNTMKSPSEIHRVKRKRLYIESGKATPQTLRGFINFLRVAQFNPEKEFYKIEISVATFPIYAEDLRELTEFPFEFQLLEKGGNLVASTGIEISPGGEEQDFHEKYSTSFYLHTHPGRQDNEGVIPMNTPSFGDLASMRVSNNPQRQLIIASPEGIVVYRRPIYNPVTQMPSLDDVNEILHHYCEQKRAEGSYPPLTDRKHVEFERRFAEDTKMIIAEASWDNSGGIAEIMDVINLRKRIDPDCPVIPSCLDNLHLKDLDEDQRENISTLGNIIDNIKNKYGIFGKVRAPTDSFIEFLKDTLTKDLAKKGITESYRQYLEQLLVEVNKLPRNNGQPA